jgi:hypothetical protein
MIGLFLICYQLATATPQPQAVITPASQPQCGQDCAIGNSGQPEINPAEAAQTTAPHHQ